MSGTCVVCKNTFDNAPIAYQGATFVPTICKTCTAAGYRSRRDGSVYQKKQQQQPDAARDLFMKPAPSPAAITSSEIIVELQRVTTLLRDIAHDTQCISRKIDEAFARLDARVEAARQ
jgi:hypothetical protein